MAFKNLTNQKFGKLTVIGESPNKAKNRQKIWICLCECGNIKHIRATHLRPGETYSCGCSRYIDITNQKFNSWTVLKPTNSLKQNKMWLCICDCGNMREVSSPSLRLGRSKSCGSCYVTENSKLQRRENLIKNWRNQIFNRDNYNCVICGQHGGKLNAHHLDGFHWYLEGRYQIENGVTLCKNCHEKFHKIYGRRKNTKIQFEEFKQLCLL